MPGFSMRAELPPGVVLNLKKDADDKDKANSEAISDINNGNDNVQGHSGHGSGDNGCGKGVLKDFKTTVAKHWWEEMINFNTKTIAVSIFLFIAVIAPCITFGAVYAKMTNNAIGAAELLLATAWCGIFYALVGGMPLMINGATGPVLTFQALLFSLSEKTLKVPFLTVRTLRISLSSFSVFAYPACFCFCFCTCPLRIDK